jgi:hypothetical protein
MAFLQMQQRARDTSLTGWTARHEAVIASRKLE